MNKILIHAMLLLFISFALADNGVFSGSSALPESNQVIITWLTNNENNIKSFIVKRSNDNKLTFNELIQVSKQGPGYEYMYIDENVFFKSSGVIYYKIDAVNKNGELVETTGEMMVHPNISGIFRTWGALKAIFR